MICKKNYVLARIKATGLSSRGVLPLALLCLLPFISAVSCSAASTQPAAKVIKPGDTFPIYLHPSVLAEANQPGVDIAVAGGAFWNPGPERYYGWAVRDLRDYLQRANKARYPLTPSSANAKNGIFAGTFTQFPAFKPQQAASRKAMASNDPEAFVVEAQGDKLFILGRSNLGLMAGIYTLLDQLGFKWFAPGQKWENVPQLSGLTLDNKLNVTSIGPTYKGRFFYSTGGLNSSTFRKGERERDYGFWNLRNRMGGSIYTNNSHNEEIIPPSLFKTRPELFARITTGPWAALTVGGRLPREIARANPEVVKLAVENAIKYLKENEGKGTFFDSFSVETGDGIPADEESLAKIGNHTPTDLNFWFANQVAAGLEKAGLKDKWIGILSYSDHSLIPTFDIHPQVAVMVTTALADESLTLEQRLDGLRQRKANRLGVYEYLNLTVWTLDKPGYSTAGFPLRIAANFKKWHEHGVNNYLAETSDSWIDGGAGHYLASRVLWNLNADPQQELNAYYKGAFGPAAQEIRAINEDWEKKPALSRGNLARWHHLISTADQKVNGKTQYQARINEVKCYYLYLNLLRELDIDLKDPRVPSRTERFARMLRYVGANRGEGAFHAFSLFTIWPAVAPAGVDVKQMGPDFTALATNFYDEEAWKKFPPIDDTQINKMFEAVKLPLGGQSTNPAVLDPAVRLFSTNAAPPAEIKFPKLHGPPIATGARRYILKVIAPTPKLTFNIVADNAAGAGEVNRTCTVIDENGNELKRLAFKINTPVSFDLIDVKPGVITATFPEMGAEQLTVSGGNAFGAVKTYDDSWGFNPFRPADLKAGEGYKAYFAVPAGSTSIKVGLSSGAVVLGFQDGDIIAPDVKGSAELKKQPQEFKFAAADKPRIAYVQWKGEYPGTEGLGIEGVTLYSPDPSYVLYESLD